MICYKCGQDVGDAKRCPNCGEDLAIFWRVRRISNSYYNLGLQQAGVRNLSGAVESLRNSLKFNKYNIAARNLLGLVYHEMGETVAALSEWVISQSYQPTDNLANGYLDEIQKNRGQLDTINQTIKKYNQALHYCQQDSRDLAIIQLKKVLSMNPKLIKGHQLLALLYLQDGKLELAKKSLRNAGRIDANNTTTLRYLKEVNTQLKEKSPSKKPKDDDLISYQSGNETIIMPKRFKESSLGASLAYIVTGLVVGAAVTAFLVVPNVKNQAKEDAVRSFQVVSGDMFSRVHEPVIRITTKGITFNKSCVSKLPDAENVELLFNPVERMMVIRPCRPDHPHAIPWDAKYKSAAPLCKVFYDSMGWETDYAFRVPCQAMKNPNAAVLGDTVLVFDLDNYVGRAMSKKDEVIIARKEAEANTEEREDAKSYYYPPDEDEPQEIRDMEEKFQQAVEVNKKLFGTPAFQHNSGVRGLSAESSDEEWDMMVEARPLDITHTVDAGTVDDLLLEIMDDPPVLPQSQEAYPGEPIVVEPTGEEE